MAFAEFVSAWPPALIERHEKELVLLANDWALSNSLVYRPPAPDQTSRPPQGSVVHAPYALYPTPFPKDQYEKSLRLSEIYSALYAHIAVDDKFLESVIGGAVCKVDDFQGGLWRIFEQVRAEGVAPDVHLGLFRSDYMLHEGLDPQHPGPPAIKQVEFNTISSSFGPLASRVTQLHTHLLRSGAYPARSGLDQECLPPNPALSSLAAGLAAAHSHYGSSTASVLMVVQDPERNAFDQRELEWELLRTHGIRLVRIPFSKLGEVATVDSSRILRVRSDLEYDYDKRSYREIEISVVYYRSAYTPTDYPSQKEWDTRLLVERSKAIKCPTVALQLAGAKKVQQVLTEEGVLEQFLGIGSSGSDSPSKAGEDSSVTTPISQLTPKDADLLRESFQALYPLDDSPLGKEALRLAYSDPSKFVLKPQREGGGNNIYRENIPPFLDQLAEKDKSKPAEEPREREGYILMELIKTPEGIENVVVRAGEESGIKGEVISELGVYGVTLFGSKRHGSLSGEERGAHIFANSRAGHLLRTKGKGTDEGGVATGFSVIDSPLLV